MFSFFSDFLALLYPDLCRACNNSLQAGEDIICMRCQLQLPKTNFHLEAINPVIKQFWGKVPVHAATAYYYFYKGEKVQHLIHQLKYKNRPEVGLKIGRLLGYELSQSNIYKDVSVVVPVPLHRDKLRMRGYNQSEQIACGIAAAYSIQSSDLIIRNRHTETQTRKHRFNRYQNVDKVFSLTDPKAVYGKHVLIVDDVVTTGSTLVSCAETVAAVEGTKVSIAAMAYAAR